MPIIKSAIKRSRQSGKHNAYNVGIKAEVKAKFKTVRDEVATGKVKDNKDLVAALTEIDRAVRKGVIKKQSAARKKSRLTKAYNSVASKPFGTEAPGKPGSKVATKKKAVAKKPVTKKSASNKAATNKPASKK